jgi:beta-glucosidase
MSDRPTPPHPHRAAFALLARAALVLSIGASTALAQTPRSRGAERFVDSLLRQMTLDEKVGQLTMTPGEWNQTGPRAPSGGEQQVREGRIGSFLSFWGAAPTREMQRIAVEQSRLHIPLLFSQDVIHGWRTVFPVSLAEAASFDTGAVRNAARIAAVEASAHGIHWTFAPMVDIARDPRWGRIVEGAGEDPHLGELMAAARVRGFQGDSGWRGMLDGAGPPTHVLATAKHFAAYGAAEGGRDYNVAEVTERTLWEVYLPPFRAAVRERVGSVMASFNDIGGTPSHASRWLLDDVLRRRWDYDGLVVSDWSGIQELMSHGVAATPEEAVVLAMRAGVDVDMSDALYSRHLATAVQKGLVPLALVDSAVKRVLRVKQALGLFEDPYRYSDTTRQRLVTLTPAHRAAARDLARKAIVLLKNDRLGDGTPVLPLSRALRSVAVIGPLADDRLAVLGSWNGAGRPEDAVSVLAGLRAALPQARIAHERGAPVESLSTGGFAAAVQAAREADAVVLVLGERADMSGEASSRASIELPGSQLALAQSVVRATRAADPRKPIVAVLMNGRPLAVQWLADSVPAIVESWLLGVEHGNALADVLLGDANPSGRLPATFPRATGQVPIYHAHRNTGRPAAQANNYTSKYLDLPWTPLWPFGHGLSYTTFSYANLRVAASRGRARDSVVVRVDVTNAGSRGGDEVAQLYVRDDAASVARPVRELKGFRRITLRAGETRTVEFVLQPVDLSLYRLDMRRVVEPGTFTLWAGGSADATLAQKYRVVGDTLTVAPAPRRIR